MSSFPDFDIAEEIMSSEDINTVVNNGKTLIFINHSLEPKKTHNIFVRDLDYNTHVFGSDFHYIETQGIEMGERLTPVKDKAVKLLISNLTEIVASNNHGKSLSQIDSEIIKEVLFKVKNLDHH